MTIKKFPLSLSFFSLSLAFLMPLSLAVSVGVSPGILPFEDMLRGGYAEKYITISTSSDETLSISTETAGDFADWISFEPTGGFTIPPRSRYKLKVIAQPPSDVPNGVYEGTVTVVARIKTSEVEGSGVTVGAAAAVRTSIVITDEQIRDYKVNEISVKDTEEGHPIEFRVSVVNLGNVRLTPRIHIDILDRDKIGAIKSVDFEEVEVLPTKGHQLLIKVPTEDLEIGQYWAEVTSYLDQKIIKEELLTFDFLERGALSVKGKLNFVMGGAWAELGDVVRIAASFSNIGELSTLAKFKGEVISGDKLVEVLESEEIDVAVGETINLTTYFRPTEIGRYEIKGVVYYSKKVTEEKSTILNVAPREPPEENKTTESPGGQVETAGADYTQLIVILVVVIAALILLNFRKEIVKKKRRPKIRG